MLEIAMWPEPEEYFSYLWSFYGIVIDIHLFEKYPEFKNIIQIQPGYDMRVFVTPTAVRTEDLVCTRSISFCQWEIWEFSFH